MRTEEYNKESLRLARRGFLLTAIGLVMTVFSIGWTVFNDLRSTDSGVVEEQPTLGVESTSADPDEGGGELPASGQELSEADAEEAAPHGPDSGVPSFICCRWYSIGTEGTWMDFTVFVIYRMWGFGLAVAIIAGFADRRFSRSRNNLSRPTIVTLWISWLIQVVMVPVALLASDIQGIGGPKWIPLFLLPIANLMAMAWYGAALYAAGIKEEAPNAAARQESRQRTPEELRAAVERAVKKARAAKETGPASRSKP